MRKRSARCQPFAPRRDHSAWRNSSQYRAYRPVSPIEPARCRWMVNFPARLRRCISRSHRHRLQPGSNGSGPAIRRPAQLPRGLDGTHRGSSAASGPERDPQPHLVRFDIGAVEEQPAVAAGHRLHPPFRAVGRMRSPGKNRLLSGMHRQFRDERLHLLAHEFERPASAKGRRLSFILAPPTERHAGRDHRGRHPAESVAPVRACEIERVPSTRFDKGARPHWPPHEPGCCNTGVDLPRLQGQSSSRIRPAR